MKSEILNIGAKSEKFRRGFLYPNFLENLFRGHFEPICPESAEKIAKSVYLSGTPIEPLDKKELEILSEYLIAHLKKRLEINNEVLTAIVNNPVYFIPAGKSVGVWYLEGGISPNFVVIDRLRTSPWTEDSKAVLKKAGIEPLSPSQKVEVFSSPSIWHNCRFTDIVNMSAGIRLGDGSRVLDEYLTRKDFLRMFRDVCKKTDSVKPRILDLGGNLGAALNDVKEIAPNSTTINVTIDDLPIFYPADQIILRPAEYLPKSFEESIDIIISNMSFYIFMYPDIALKACIKMLKPGGAGIIQFSASRSALIDRLFEEAPKENFIELRERLKSLGAWLEKQRMTGVIEGTESLETKLKEIKLFSDIRDISETLWLKKLIRSEKT